MLKITLHQIDSGENEVIVRYLQIDREVEVIAALFRGVGQVIAEHVAFYTDGAIRSMNEVTLRNLKEFEDTGTCRNEVK